MAEIIPDRLPARASAGEKKLFSVLQKLPDDYIAYYEPIVEDRYPDFVVICPDLGLLIIEVKGWYPKDILAANSNFVSVKESRGEVRRNHPIRQARDYMLSLMDQCQNHHYSGRLLQSEGEYKGRFIFPFGHFAVLSNINTTQLSGHSCGDLTQVFPANKVVPRDVIEQWMEDDFSGDKLIDTFRVFFNPSWDFPKLDQGKINAIRSIVHPEIILGLSQTIAPKKEQSSRGKPLPVKVNPEQRQNSTTEGSTSEDLNLIDIKVLDLRQENNARRIGEGHRIIYGVAGSGKTVLLIAKARLLSHQKPDAKILLLCYNVTLAAYLREAVRSCTNVTASHFDGWAKANNCVRRKDESNEEFGERFLLALENGCTDSYRYDAILIDEAQDFAVSWYQCCLAAMQEPNDGDLIIVGDGSQGLYGRTKISWGDIGINARGRTIHSKFDLDKNYRNAREIVELASIFAQSTSTKDNEQDGESIVSLYVDPTKCSRTGAKPVLIKSNSRRDECTVVLSLTKNLLDGQWFGNPIAPLKPEEIAIFYPLAYKNEKSILSNLIDGLSDIASVCWLNDPNDWKAKTKVNQPGIKIQTVHSAKGLQYKAVIFMWADHLPRPFEDISEEEDRCLMYVGITRPEDYLVITASGNSPFITEIEESGKVDFA